MQTIYDESQKGSEFYQYLARVEYQAARLGGNPHFNLTKDSFNNHMRDKSIDLMTAIVLFFDSALVYFQSNVFGMSLISQI